METEKSCNETKKVPTFGRPALKKGDSIRSQIGRVLGVFAVTLFVLFATAAWARSIAFDLRFVTVNGLDCRSLTTFWGLFDICSTGVATDISFGV